MIERDVQSFEADLITVGGYMTTALQEIAMELGGEELVAKLTGSGKPDSVWPAVEALQMLREIDPDAVMRMLDRTTEIQLEAHRQQIRDLRRPSRYGKAMLRGAASLNIWPTFSRR